MQNRHQRLGHDDFVLEAARRDDEQEYAHDKECERIGPQVRDSRAAEDDATRDVDEVGGRNEITEDAKDERHRFARENVAAEEDAGKNRQEGKLHGFELRIRFTRDENPKRERNKQIGKRQ